LNQAQEMDNPAPDAPEKHKSKPRWFFRDRAGRVRCALAGVPFLLGCVGAAALFVLYRWPRPTAPIVFFTIWPAFIWFGLLLPLLVPGAAAVRLRWFLCGCLLWLLALGTTEEIVQCLKPFAERSRARFQSASFAVRTALSSGDATRDYSRFPLRIVTWNVSLSKLGSPEEAVRRLADMDPDVVFLQEYSGGRLDRPIARSPRFGAYRKARHERVVLLSRFPIVPLAKGPRLPGHCILRRIEIAPGRRVTLLNVHLPHLLLTTRPRLRGWNSAEAAANIRRTNENLDAVARAVRPYANEPIIVGGDFTLPPHYPRLADALEGLQDCFAANGYGWGKTMSEASWSLRMRLMRLDMIFVPRDAEVAYCAAIPTELSDHAMVIAEVYLPLALRPQDQSAAPERDRQEPARP